MITFSASSAVCTDGRFMKLFCIGIFVTEGDHSLFVSCRVA
jgi:hypothetical protein